jgi:L,D-transpeptidase ErfK/SrfK
LLADSAAFIINVKYVLCGILLKPPHSKVRLGAALLAVIIAAAIFGAQPGAMAWREEDFAHRTVVAYPLSPGRDNMIGERMTYRLRKGDTLLDVGRWFDITAKEISEANQHIDWWTPPAGKEILLPGEHVIPECSRKGVVLNIPEMRLYYFPVRVAPHHKHGKLTPASYSAAEIVYTFPVGLGRFDWKTPVGAFKIRGKTHNPTWVVPKAIYEEHLERDGEADHMIAGGDPDNPLGHYRVELTLPSYALHGTNVPWGVGMEVSHGCVRLYPEDIEALYKMVTVGAPGEFVYEPVKFGWKNDELYVEVHEDLYGMYPGLWNQALKEVERQGLGEAIDYNKLEKAVEQKTGVPTYIMPGKNPNPSTPDVL